MLLSAAILAVAVAATPSIKDLRLPCVSQTSAAKDLKMNDVKKNPNKLTPKQERAMQLLRGVEAEAEAAEPAMQTYLLMRLSRFWRECSGDLKSALPMFRRAMEASKDVEDTRDLRSSMQVSIARVLPPDELEKFLPMMADEARSEMLPLLAQYFAHEKQYDKAVAVFEQFAEAKQFPYLAAGEVVKTLPPSAGIERRRLFTTAMQWAHVHGETPQPGLYDLGALVVDCWTYLPESQVNEAIDFLLAQARQELNPAPTTVVINEKRMQFQSTYEYRLFQLLPLIKALDTSKAEQLIAQEPGIRMALEKYPEGMKSFGGGEFGDRSFIMGSSQDQEGENAQFQNSIFSLLRGRKFDAALEKAAQWNASSHDKNVGTMTLLNIANLAATEDPEVAKKGLRMAERSAANLSGHDYSIAATTACEIWSRLDQPENCDRMLPKATRSVEAEADAEGASKEPNLAFKGYWPQLSDLEGVVYFNCQRNSEGVDDLINGIADEEYKTILRLTQARCLLDLKRERWQPQVIRDGKQTMWASF